MNSLEKHIQQTLALTNSLVIKITDVAVNINRGLFYSAVDNIPADKRKWKYYLNMAGQLHDTNQNFTVKVVETEETKTVGRDIVGYKRDDDGNILKDSSGDYITYTYDYLFPELLEEYPYTKEELIKQGNVYKNLVELYPEEESYIKGCLFPVDIDTAIAAKDGTILNWNTSLVETSEYGLIKELESHIQNFLKRWHVSNYTLTDELYVPAMVAVLYSSLPNKVLNIRMDKILTNEAHSFHLEHFFRSKLDLWEGVQIFKNETKYWLYKNLPYLIKHLGSNEVLKIIIDKVYEANGIGVGEFLLKRDDPTLDTERQYLDTKPLYSNKEPVLEAKALNASYDVDLGGLTLSSILETEINQVNQEFKDSDTLASMLKIMKNNLNAIHNLKNNQQETKLLDVKISRVFRRTGQDVFRTIMDYWSYLCYIEAVDGKFDFNTDDAYDENSGGSRSLIDFTDPNTKTLYSLTAKQGFLFALKLMLMLASSKNDKKEVVGYNRLEDKIKGYRYTTVFNADRYSLKYIWDKMYQDGWTDLLIDDLIENYPRVNTFIHNRASFHDYLSKILQYQYYIWAMDANSESSIVSASIKQLFRYNVQEGEFKLTDDEDGKTIDQLIADEGLSFEVTESYSPSTALNALVNAFTAFDTEEYYAKEELVNSCIDVLNKLTAYTTQVITTSDTISSLYLYYNNTGIWRSRYGVVGDVNFDFHPVEHEFFRIDVKGRNVIEDPVVVLVNNDKAQAGYEKVPPTEGYGYYENQPDVFSKIDPPRAVVEVSEIFDFDLTKGHIEEVEKEDTDDERVLSTVSEPVFISGQTIVYPDEGPYKLSFRCDKGSTMNVIVPSRKGIARVISSGETTLVEYDPPDVEETETVIIHFFATKDGQTSKLVPLTITVIGN